VRGRLRRGDEAAGSTLPAVRLAVTPPLLRAGARLRAAGRAGAFPFAAPTRPGTLPAPPVEERLGVAYDTDWARRYPARLARLALQEGLARPLVAALASPEVDGADRLAHLHGPVVFAANHSSHVDTPLLCSVIPEPWRNQLVVASAADYFFDTRLKAATFALALGAVPIERRRVDRRSTDRLAELVGQGWSLLIYPEGGRSPDGWGQAHRAGWARLAVRAGRPVVPVYLAGTRAILPRHGSRLRRGQARVCFGRPLDPGSDPRALAAAVEAGIDALADEEATDWWSATRRAAAGRSPTLRGPAGVGAWRRAWAADPGRPGRTQRRWP